MLEKGSGKSNSSFDPTKRGEGGGKGLSHAERGHNKILK